MTTKKKSYSSILGKRGDPFSIHQALRRTNPNFSPKEKAYTENCQRCALAYELLRRGYNVQAKGTFDGDTFNQVDKTIQVFSQKGRLFISKKKDFSKELRKMTKNGNGRFLVLLFGKGRIGHAFNIELRHNRFYSYDGQYGTSGVFKKYLSYLKFTFAYVYRIDNVAFNEKIAKAVRRGEYLR